MGIDVTGTAQRDAWQRRVLPPVERVRPGLWSIPVPIPVGTLRYTLVYVLELPEGVALVDVGYDTGDAWAALTAGLAATGHTTADVRWLSSHISTATTTVSPAGCGTRRAAGSACTGWRRRA